MNGVTANGKVYNANTTAVLGGTAAIAALGTDVVTLGGAGSGVFADKNVGNGKAVTVTGYSISGTDAGNYSLAQPTGLTADVTVRPLTAKADDATKIQGASNPAFTASLTGLAAPDTAADLSGALVFATPANTLSPMGQYAVTPSGYTSTNYAIAFQNGVLSITTQAPTNTSGASLPSGAQGAITNAQAQGGTGAGAGLGGAAGGTAGANVGGGSGAGGNASGGSGTAGSGSAGGNAGNSAGSTVGGNAGSGAGAGGNASGGSGASGAGSAGAGSAGGTGSGAGAGNSLAQTSLNELTELVNQFRQELQAGNSTRLPAMRSISVVLERLDAESRSGGTRNLQLEALAQLREELQDLLLRSESSSVARGIFRLFQAVRGGMRGPFFGGGG